MDIIDVLKAKGKLENDLALSVLGLCGKFTKTTGVGVRDINVVFDQDMVVSATNKKDYFFGGVKVMLDL